MGERLFHAALVSHLALEVLIVEIFLLGQKSMF